MDVANLHCQIEREENTLALDQRVREAKQQFEDDQHSLQAGLEKALPESLAAEDALKRAVKLESRALRTTHKAIACQRLREVARHQLRFSG